MARYTLFDFDGTLTRGDSFTGFIRHVHGTWGLIRVLLKSAPAIALWKSGLRDNTYAKLRMFAAAFRGMPIDEFRRHGEDYITGIDRMLRTEVVDELRSAVSQGDKVAIVSASLGDWIRPWAHANGVQHVLATEPETDAAGSLTGRFSRQNCQREEKCRRILEAFPEIADNRSECHVTAWGDSDGDTEMLELADEPHRLHKARRKR